MAQGGDSIFAERAFRKGHGKPRRDVRINPAFNDQSGSKSTPSSKPKADRMAKKTQAKWKCSNFNSSHMLCKKKLRNVSKRPLFL